MFLYVCDVSLAPSASMPFPLMQLSVAFWSKLNMHTLSQSLSTFIWLMMMMMMMMTLHHLLFSFSTLMPYVFFVQ
jgi:hypothetical protein